MMQKVDIIIPMKEPEARSAYDNLIMAFKNTKSTL